MTEPTISQQADAWIRNTARRHVAVPPRRGESLDDALRRGMVAMRGNELQPPDEDPTTQENT